MSNNTNDLKLNFLDGNNLDPLTKLVDLSGLQAYHDKLSENVLSVTVTENGQNILNKDNLTIGNFEIVSGQLFNYTLKGSYPVASNEYMNIVAEYDKGEPYYTEYYYEDMDTGVVFQYNGYVYNFIITEASCLNPEEHNPEYLIGRTLTIPAYIINNDTKYADFVENDDNNFVRNLEFVDGKTESIVLPYSGLYGQFEETTYLLEGSFTQSVPFALRSSSKALLNGHQVVTSDMLTNTENAIKDALRDELTKNVVNSQVHVEIYDESGNNDDIASIDTLIKNNDGEINIHRSNYQYHDGSPEKICESKINVNDNIEIEVINTNEYDESGSTSISIDADSLDINFKDAGDRTIINNTITINKNGILIDDKQVATTNYVDNKIDNIDIPTSLPANGGNADTVDGKHADDFATADHTHDRFTSDLVHFDGAIHICNVSEDASDNVSGIYFSNNVEDDLYEPAYAFIREDGDDRLIVHGNYELKLSTGGNASGNSTTEIDGPSIRVISNPDENDALTNTIQMNAENGVFVNGVEVAVKSDIPDANVIGDNIITEEGGITLNDDEDNNRIQIHGDGIFIYAHGAELLMDDGDFRFIKGNLIVDEDGDGNGYKVATEKFVEQYALSDTNIASMNEINAVLESFDFTYDNTESM